MEVFHCCKFKKETIVFFTHMQILFNSAIELFKLQKNIGYGTLAFKRVFNLTYRMFFSKFIRKNKIQPTKTMLIKPLINLLKSDS